MIVWALFVVSALGSLSTACGERERLHLDGRLFLEVVSYRIVDAPSSEDGEPDTASIWLEIKFRRIQEAEAFRDRVAYGGKASPRISFRAYGSVYRGVDWSTHQLDNPRMIRVKLVPVE